MDTWINQGGYPLVRLGEGGSLTQDPFSYQEAPGGAIGSDWQIPVLVRPLGPEPATSDPVLLGAEPLSVPGVSAGSVAQGAQEAQADIVVNAGGSGYFRVAYPSATLGRLAGRIGELAPLERYNLVSDTWAAVLAGRAPVDDLLGVATALERSHERDPSVWSVVLGALALFDRVIAEDDRPVLARAVRALLSPLADDLGFDPRPDDTERVPSLRAGVIRSLGTVGADPGVRDEAAKRFGGGGDAAPLDPDTESAILDVVAATGDAGVFDAYLARYRAPANPQEENRYLYALASFEDPVLAGRAFELALGEVRTQNAPFLIQLLLANRTTGPATWGRVTESWDEVVDRFPTNILPRMLDGVRGLCTPPELAADVTAFVESHPIPTGAKTVEQIVERLAVNVAFGRREARRLASALTALVEGGAG